MCLDKLRESDTVWWIISCIMLEYGSVTFLHLVARSCRDIKKCRKVLQRAVQSASDNPEIVIQALLSFEREEGE